MMKRLFTALFLACSLVAPPEPVRAEDDPSPSRADSTRKPTLTKSTGLRKKFSASKVSFDEKSGVLTLAYDFSKPTQLADFECKRGVATVGQGAVRIAAAETLTHVAEFKQGTISGRFAYGNANGQQTMLNVTGLARVDFQSFNEMWIKLYSEGKELAARDAGHRLPLVIQWDINPNKSRLLVDGKELAGLRGQAPDIGRFGLHGGNAGLKVAGLVISGIPKDGWLEGFLAE